MRHLRWKCANGCAWGQYMARLLLWNECPFCGCADVECEGE